MTVEHVMSIIRRSIYGGMHKERVERDIVEGTFSIGDTEDIVTATQELHAASIQLKTLKNLWYTITGEEFTP